MINILGGDIRMRAASNIANRYPLIIVVGGSKEKVSGMKLFLMRNSVEHHKIIRLESNPETNGNLNAIRKIFDHYKKLKEYSIDILSNNYHGERIKKMASDILAGLGWEFISAENFLKEESEIVEKMYFKQFKNRKKSEKQGVEDWNNECYENQDIEAWQFKSIIHDPELFKSV